MALEQRTEERGLRRQLRALHDPRGRSGLTAACRRNLGLPANHPSLVALAEAVDNAGASVDSLADQLRRFVHNQTVVGEEDLRRYGVRVRLDATALSAAGGPALRTAADSLQDQLRALLTSLGQVINDAAAVIDAGAVPAGRRPRCASSVWPARFQRALKVEHHYRWFWSFADPTRTVRIVELGRTTTTPKPAATSPRP